jgi:pimeloyl-ACP methyl ester carboxylesterase
MEYGSHSQGGTEPVLPRPMEPSSMSDPVIQHRQIEVGELSMHIAEAGEGPLVLLCHGFPECWYSWRHQLEALAAAGYHAVAPDMRGYGRTTGAPEDAEHSTIFHLVGDLVGLLDKLGEEQAVVVGHDWGSMVAWNAAQLRPDRFRAVVGMSVSFMPRMPVRPLQMMKAMAGDNFMYILYFQEPGKAEAELNPNAREFMRKMLYTASGSVDRAELGGMLQPKTAKFMDGMVEPDKLPDWLSEEDLDTYVEEFERTGFTGGLNWYRNFDRNWELMAPFADRRITVPATFIGGLRDFVVTGPTGEGEGPMVAMLGSFCDDLRGKTLIEGAGHWNQQEAPGETNAALIEFLEGL